MEQLKRAGYVLIGTGDLVVEKAKGAFDRTRSLTRKDVESLYGNLSKRGHSTFQKVSRSKPAKQAIEGTKQATRQLKGAATSLKKATGAEEETKAS